MAHYMMDCYFVDPNAVDGVRREPKRVVAISDDEAIQEAKRVAIGLKDIPFRLRKVSNLADQVIYDSRDGT
jgi:hypothetical protein